MEHRINKVDVELINRVNEANSEKIVHCVDKTTDEVDIMDYDNGEENKNDKRDVKSQKKIVIDAYKHIDEINVVAEKADEITDGVYLDARR